MYAVLKVSQSACIFSKDILALHECRWRVTCSSVPRARPSGARSQPCARTPSRRPAARSARSWPPSRDRRLRRRDACARSASDERARARHSGSCGSRRGGRVRLRAARAAKSEKRTSTTATTGPASGGCAAAMDVLQLSTSQRRTSAASSVLPGGLSRSRASLATHAGILSSDDERSPRPTTMAEVGGDGEQRAAAAYRPLAGKRAHPTPHPTTAVRESSVELP